MKPDGTRELSRSLLSPEEVGRLLAALAERPVDQGGLWAACWGEDERNGQRIPANIARIAEDILKANQSRVILVHGRYGTGKSSFMKSICAQIECNVIPLWLDMPSLTSHIESTALAAVMLQIADKLQAEAGNSGFAKFDFGRALEDLWRIEAGATSFACHDPYRPVVPPEPNRMAGTLRGEGRRVVRANTLEKEIERSIQLLGTGAKRQMPMVVFLDDLDRCERAVAMDVVRLLLRFGPVSNVHFVLACDWDVLEQGVKDWMHQHGKADNGMPLVTANSALEKYIHIPVKLPGMGVVAGMRKKMEVQLPLSLRNVLTQADDGEGITVNDKYKAAQLFDILVDNLMHEAYAEARS